MPDIKGYRLYVKLGAAQVRKRLKGVGYGVRRVGDGREGPSGHHPYGDRRSPPKALCCV